MSRSTWKAPYSYTVLESLKSFKFTFEKYHEAQMQFISNLSYNIGYIPKHRLNWNSFHQPEQREHVATFQKIGLIAK